MKYLVVRFISESNGLVKNDSFVDIWLQTDTFEGKVYPLFLYCNGCYYQYCSCATINDDTQRVVYRQFEITQFFIFLASNSFTRILNHVSQ